MGRAAGDERGYRIGVLNMRGKVVEELPKFPSVTTIIGDTDGTKTDILLRWALNVNAQGVADLLERGSIKQGSTARTIKHYLKRFKVDNFANRDESAERGTHIHNWAEKLLLGTATYDDVLEDTPAKWRGYADALIKWHQQYANEVVAVERVMVSLTHGYAGTVDLIDQTPDGRIRVCDFKTSSRIYDTHFIQGDAYALAWVEMCERRGNPMPVNEVVVIRFASDGSYEEQSASPEGGRVFLKMLALFNARNGV
jgi:hypothetical protein